MGPWDPRNAFWGSRTGSKAATFLVAVALVAVVADGKRVVPALFVFGDSMVDVGNNNNNPFSLVRANFPPYGRDFLGGIPTGRFCNGKLTTDYIAENLGFTTYQPPYLGQLATRENLLLGANFASGASGFWDPTAALYGAVPLTQQLENYKQYQSRVLNVTRRKQADGLFSHGIYLVSAGSSDYLQNYYINPAVYGAYTPALFGNVLVTGFTTFIQNLYGLGARKIGVTTLPPIGCLPMAITLFGGGNNSCVARMNEDAYAFNAKIAEAARGLREDLPGLKLVVLDIYQPLHDIVRDPAAHGFVEARRACCGTGTLEMSLTCNSRTVGTCSNATAYVFWDSFHPTEAANKLLAERLMLQGVVFIN